MWPYPSLASAISLLYGVESPCRSAVPARSIFRYEAYGVYPAVERASTSAPTPRCRARGQATSSPSRRRALPSQVAERRHAIAIERTPVVIRLGYQALSPLTG